MRRVVPLTLLLTVLAAAPARGQFPMEDPFVPLALALSRDGQLFATSQFIKRGRQGAEITVTEARTGKERFKLQWAETTTLGLALSPDGKRLALVGGDHVTSSERFGRVQVVET